MDVQNKSGDELEKLFLLELLVDKIEIDWKKIDIEQQVLRKLKGHCLRFEFLNYPPLEVCEEDFCENSVEDIEDGRSEVVFKSGKSCLFSLRSSTPELRCFMIRATLLRKKTIPPHHVIGKACINLGENFINVINTVQTSYDTGPITETIKDKYSIRIANGTEIGKLTLMTRLSSFGKMIITQFQLTDEEKKTFIFKNEDTKMQETVGDVPAGTDTARFSTRKGPYCDGDTREKYSPLGVPQPERFENIPCDLLNAPSTSNYNDITAPGLPPNVYGMPNMQLQRRSMLQPQFGMVSAQTAVMAPQFGMMPCGQVGGMGIPPLSEQLLGGAGGLLGGSPFNLMPGLSYGFLGPPPTGLLGGNPESIYGAPFEPMSYKDIGLIANGQPIDVKVAKQKNKNKFPQFPFCGKIPARDDSSSSSEEEEEMQIPPQPAHPPLNFCECDYPLPQWYGTQCPPQPPQKKKKKKKKKKPKCPFELGGNLCFKPDCPMGYPQFGGMGKTQCTQMQMPSGTIALKEDQVVFQMPKKEQPAYPLGYTTAWDPNDMFSLKVGRKVNMNDQNTKVELQYEPAPPKKVCRMDIETQYSPADFGGLVETVGGDKGKGKGKGKGKDGKKGKKKK